MKGNISNWSYLEDYGVIWRIMEKKGEIHCFMCNIVYFLIRVKVTRETRHIPLPSGKIIH